MNEDELAKAVNAWNDKRQADRNRYNRSPVGLAIKRAVESTSNWRNAPRGNPSKGRETALRNLAEQDQW